MKQKESLIAQELSMGKTWRKIQALWKVITKKISDSILEYFMETADWILTSFPSFVTLFLRLQTWIKISPSIIHIYCPPMLFSNNITIENRENLQVFLQYRHFHVIRYSDYNILRTCKNLDFDSLTYRVVPLRRVWGLSHWPCKGRGLAKPFLSSIVHLPEIAVRCVPRWTTISLSYYFGTNGPPRYTRRATECLHSLDYLSKELFTGDLQLRISGIFST